MNEIQINYQNDKLYEIQYDKNVWMSNKNVMTRGLVWVAWGPWDLACPITLNYALYQHRHRLFRPVGKRGIVRIFAFTLFNSSNILFGVYEFKIIFCDFLKRRLFLGRCLAFAVFWDKTQSAPIVTARLAKIAILARMLFETFLLSFRNINFSR